MDGETRVVIDARKLGDGGIGVYIENLIRGILEERRSCNLALSLLVSPAAIRRRSPAIRDNVLELLREWAGEVRLIEEDADQYSLSESFLLGIRCRDILREHHLFHSPHYTLPRFIPIPTVATIHDIIHVTHPEHWYHRVFGTLLIRSAIRRADHIICVSHHAHAQVQRLGRRSRASFSVVPNALRDRIGPASAAEGEEVRGGLGIAQPYFLFVGSERPHKGFSELIVAWALMRLTLAGQSQEVPLLVAVGSRFNEPARRLVEAEKVADTVHFVGDVPIDTLRALYTGALGVVVPSREEGFGFVALEALAAGVPVICFPLKSLQEICGNCAWYAEKSGSEALARAVLASLTNPKISGTKVRDGLERAQWFSRKLMSQRTIEVYAKVLGHSILAEDGVSQRRCVEAL